MIRFFITVFFLSFLFPNVFGMEQSAMQVEQNETLDGTIQYFHYKDLTTDKEVKHKAIAALKTVVQGDFTISNFKNHKFKIDQHTHKAPFDIFNGKALYLVEALENMKDYLEKIVEIKKQVEKLDGYRQFKEAFLTITKDNIIILRYYDYHNTIHITTFDILKNGKKIILEKIILKYEISYSGAFIDLFSSVSINE